ncbi:MAG: DUF3604 domain-containing protein [Microbacterium sp.]
MPLYRPTTDLDCYADMTAYAGDLHNHCGISYGHGTIESAFANAKQQLDFASVTGHAAWHDIPAEPRAVHDYHIEGFARLASQWDRVQEVTAAAHEDGEFVSFLSLEWHSLTYGDHCVYFRSDHGPLEVAQAQSLEELRGRLREIAASGVPTMVLPHHIGYGTGHRGINWSTYTEELSPVVELVSMHGSGEAQPGLRQYLHTMGPRDGASTAQHGLTLGHRFGFIGSTDHHSAHPGSYGYGKAMVWADSLTRDGIWDAIQARRTYAVTGDRIMLATAVNGMPMGSEVTASGSRRIEVDVLGGDHVDFVEVLRNNEVIAVGRPAAVSAPSDFDGVLAVSVGWGEYGVEVDWDVSIRVRGGRILSVDPRLHGEDIVDPLRKASDAPGATTRWTQQDDHTIALVTTTRGNPTVLTDATQQLGLQVIGDGNTVLEVTANGRTVQATVAELREGSRSAYTGGFVSPAILLHRAVDRSARTVRLDVEDAGSGGDGTDWYYTRVRQANDQYAWSSPTWVTTGA